MRLFNFLPKTVLVAALICCFVGNAQSQKASKTEKALYKQAFNYLDLEQYPEAIKDYLQLLEMRPKNSQYNFHSIKRIMHFY